MRICALSLLIGLGFAASTGGGPPRDDPSSLDGAAMRRVPKVEAINQGCPGVVLEVTRNSITVMPEDGGKIRRFKASPILAAGGFAPNAFEGWRYRLADLAVGDRINLDYDRIDGVNICQKFCIRRRPGGRVPPSNDKPMNIPHHELMNARQDLEEKGIPLPDRFLPPWELEAKRAKIAPMPRVHIPPIPPAMP